jgi:hypothetical protein
VLRPIAANGKEVLVDKKDFMLEGHSALLFYDPKKAKRSQEQNKLPRLHNICSSPFTFSGDDKISM